MTQLRSERIYLRPARPGDEETIYRWENDEELLAFTDRPDAVSMEDIKAFLEDPFNDIYTRKQLRLMICLKLDDSLAGAIDLYDFNKGQSRCGLGINIEPQLRRKGLGAEALGIVANYALESLGLKQLWATIPVSNEASLSLFQSQGFEITGRLKQWLRADSMVFQDVFFCQCFL